MSEGVEEYRGKHLMLRFEGSKCIHSRSCVLAQPGVYRANVEGPWIDPDGASVAAVVETAHACPSGAITYQRIDGGEDESAPRVNVARVRANGPMALHGALVIEGHGPAIRATLCRCGASKRKPFCDGSHADASFEATGEPATGKTDALEARDGELRVTPTTNGPLQVEGNLEVVSGTGRAILRTKKCWLCRCGSSKNKPFCDGSHNKVGWKSA